MSGRARTLGEIAARKRELIRRAAEQREALAEDAAAFSPAFALGVAGAGVLLLVLFRRPAYACATRAFALWNGTRAVRRLLALHG